MCQCVQFQQLIAKKNRRDIVLQSQQDKVNLFRSVSFHFQLWPRNVDMLRSHRQPILSVKKMQRIKTVRK